MEGLNNDMSPENHQVEEKFHSVNKLSSNKSAKNEKRAITDLDGSNGFRDILFQSQGFEKTDVAIW